jgi:hypothetical protein
MTKQDAATAEDIIEEDDDGLGRSDRRPTAGQGGSPSR